MSRIGKKPITIPQKVTAELKDDKIIVKSDKAELIQAIPAEIKVEITKDTILVKNNSKARQAKALHGLIRSLIDNMITGVTQGYQKILELQGTGYRANPKDGGIELSLGFSHPVIYSPPDDILLKVKDQKLITISGVNKQLVGQVAAKIRSFRPPDPYKGKGIRYQNEMVKLKPGKAAKAAEA